MQGQEAKKSPGFLEYVFELIGDDTLDRAFELSVEDIEALDIAQLKRIALKTYAPGKWTINKIIQHLADQERMWCYDAILYARNTGHIPGTVDHELMVDHSNADELPIEQLVNELRIVRQSTIMLFKSFNKKMLESMCVFAEYQMPMYTIGLTIAAHQIHHFNIIKERYLPLDYE